MAALKLVCIAVVCMVLASTAVDALTCGQVTGSLAPCIPYVQGRAPAVPPKCCIGIRSISSSAKTTADRQAACNCLKSAASGISGLNLGLVQQLPAKCHVSVPYTISPSTDCSKVK